MMFPYTRHRRLRLNPVLRRLVRETGLTVNDLVYPLFVTCGSGIKKEIVSMPGVFNMSPDVALQECISVEKIGIGAVILFGLPMFKDSVASGAYDDNEAVQQTVRAVKENTKLIVITDVCLCEYMIHGHCGIVKGERVDNDETLPLLAQTALSHAKAGADIVAPSDMMDGRVKVIRAALDGEGYQNTLILSYAVKYASAFYGPFREAANSAPAFGDRKSYQMDSANRREALKEALSDVEEGADMIMVKPAIAYLDIIRELREKVDIPLAAYNVSGEYSMIKAAAQSGWIDYNSAVLEILTAIKRAGSDIIISYFSKDAAALL
ncbi:MAG: porphobilinogen synthase [Deferribacteraceae bacterium]|jgi:porphobilinogen synthase|nr:porphobilinogen synthase [Deferribacteraceae bacterium]